MQSSKGDGVAQEMSLEFGECVSGGVGVARTFWCGLRMSGVPGCSTKGATCCRGAMEDDFKVACYIEL